MVRCKFCGNEITYLLNVEKIRVKFRAIPYVGDKSEGEVIYYNDYQMRKEVEYYICPHCFKVLAYSEDEVLKLFSNDKVKQKKIKEGEVVKYDG